MGLWDDFAKSLDSDIADLKKHLGWLQSGNVQIRHRGTDGQWSDSTKGEIEWHKSTIARLEALSVDARKRSGT